MKDVWYQDCDFQGYLATFGLFPLLISCQHFYNTATTISNQSSKAFVLTIFLSFIHSTKHLCTFLMHERSMPSAPFKRHLFIHFKHLCPLFFLLKWSQPTAKISPSQSPSVISRYHLLTWKPFLKRVQVMTEKRK